MLDFDVVVVVVVAVVVAAVVVVVVVVVLMMVQVLPLLLSPKGFWSCLTPGVKPTSGGMIAGIGQRYARTRSKSCAKRVISVLFTSLAGVASTQRFLDFSYS